MSMLIIVLNDFFSSLTDSVDFHDSQQICFHIFFVAFNQRPIYSVLSLDFSSQTQRKSTQ